MKKNDFEIESKKAQFMVSNAMQDITNSTRKVLLDYVHDQYLLTFARVIAYLGAESKESQELLEEMDFIIKDKVLSFVKDFNKNDETVINEIEHIVQNSGINLEPDFQIIKDNLLKTGQIYTENAIHDFKKETPIFTKRIDECIFNFEDIKYLNNRDMQKVLREVDQQELAIALKGTDTEIQDKFFTNMSTRAAAMLKEDMEFMGPVPVSRLEKCKVSIVQKIFYLAENRDIMLISQMEAGELVN